MKYLIKIDRIAAWILLISILIYAISGFGMTKGIISYDFANKLHLTWLAPIALIAFTIHTYYAIHLSFKRWQIWKTFTKVLLFATYLAIFLGFVYVDKYYVKPTKQSVTTTINSTKSNQTTQIPDTTTQSTDQIQQQSSTGTQTRTFTSSELAKYNGKNGQPAYVAVDGKVYDLTSVFRNGTHHGFSAGQDQSAAFRSQHYDSILNGYLVVGALAQ